MASNIIGDTLKSPVKLVLISLVFFAFSFVTVKVDALNFVSMPLALLGVIAVTFAIINLHWSLLLLVCIGSLYGLGSGLQTEEASDYILLPLFTVTMIASGIGLLVKILSQSTAKAVKFAEYAKEYKYSHFCNDTAIAIDPDTKRILLRSGGYEKVYPFEEVRGWSAEMRTGGEVSGAVGQAAAFQMGHNIRVQRENKAASGIFINVKDINMPKWRVAYPNQGLMDRWAEILRQTLSD